MTRSWPLVERQIEFDTIRSALTDDNGGCGVVLVGDAGVGKTTLARTATSSLPDDVKWVAGTESARSIPLGVFAHLVGASTSRDPVTFLSAARESLLADGHIIIGVDDAHLLDQLSATLLHQLAIDRAVHIVATVRSGETVPDAVTSLWKDGHLKLLDLSPFTKVQSVELIESVLGGHLEGLSSDLIWEASGGNALFLRHLVEGAVESGAMRQVSGVWQLRGRTAITSELASLLEGRIDQLPDPVLHALKLLTFCEPLDLDALEELAGEEAVEEAEARGVVKIEQDGHRLTVRYTHPMLGDVIRRRLGLASARRLRGQLVKALQVRDISSPSERVRLAELIMDSDQEGNEALLCSAAKYTITMGNLSLGERFAREALNRGGGLAAADLLARSLLWQGRPQEVEQTLLPYEPADLDEVQLINWGGTRIANFIFSMGNSRLVAETFDLLRKRLTAPPLVLLVDGIASAHALHENRLTDAVEFAERVLADPDALPWAVEWAVFGGERALALMGRGDRCAALSERVNAIGSKLDGLLRYPAMFGEIHALVLAGELTKARQLAAKYSEFSSSGQYMAWAMANTLVGVVEVGQGRFPAAIERLEQAVAAMASDSAAAWSFPARIAVAQAYSALGRSTDAQREIAAAQSRGGKHVAVFGPQLELARAWAAASEGTTGRAVDLARGSAVAAAESGQFAIEAEALHAAARFGDKTVADRLAEVAAQIDGRMVGVQARYAAAFATDDGLGLDSAAAEFESLGALLYAADAAAHAASAHDRAGNRRQTVESAATASRLAALCGGASTPALSAAAQPLPLTSREREIANLVAARLSNKEIADRLFVSVRTVEGHLYRACIKLDVSDRDALGALMRGEGG
ncbi:helix-turn-helix transcriptional regulator [Antrihabitans cavernicola]|uniref:Helix-turn-helix transcriptional regulator n=1 Tax=Antrihabitans cavernicola TaxID=2495913 RepID=A0A5A7S1B5_9NOCA|nr:LuxR family transcriptional regulator [Spelaeibacter cavernicola]KAA0017069.1 helix-turn-helix transcriptional regulator [Spelaeibacter cavernicola]